MNELSKLHEVVEWEEDLSKEYIENIGKIFGDIKDRKIELRRLYRVARAVKEIDEKNYRKLLLYIPDLLKKIQLRPGYHGKVYIGGYSPETGYKYRLAAPDTYLKTVEGGFPTLIRKMDAYISGLYPDIDSTASALILLIDAANELNIFDEEIDEIIRRGIKYLTSRDLNNDGLLEQLENEDWMIGLSREGSVLYSNALYLKLLEKTFYLYIDKDKEFAENIQDLLLKCYDSIENYFWLENFYVDSISLRGGIVIRYSIDSSELGDTFIYRKHDRFITHLKTLLSRLEGDRDKWALKNIYPSKADESYMINYSGYNGGIIPYYLAFFSRILSRYSLENYSPLILKKAIDFRNYEWILDNNTSRNSYKIETIAEILASIEELRRKLRS